MLGLQFSCDVEECSFKGSYKEAIEHKNTCEHKLKVCPQGCGLAVRSQDMQYHCYKQCKLFKIECENCEEASYPNDPERGGAGIEGHDCV